MQVLYCMHITSTLLWMSSLSSLISFSRQGRKWEISSEWLKTVIRNFVDEKKNLFRNKETLFSRIFIWIAWEPAHTPVKPNKKDLENQTQIRKWSTLSKTTRIARGREMPEGLEPWFNQAAWLLNTNCSHTFALEALQVEVFFLWKLDGLSFALLSTTLARHFP